MRKILILTLVLILSYPIYAQHGKKSCNDYYFFDDEYFRYGKPTIDISYGASTTSIKNSGINFAGSGLLELELGYNYAGKSKRGYKIVKYKDNFLFGSYIKPDLSLSKNTSSHGEQTWRFGAGTSSGYGYIIGKKSYLILYNKNSLVWSRFDSGLDTAVNQSWPSNSTPINDFNKTFRFGTGTEAGIIIPIAGLINFHIKYDRTLVFPRHLFWQNLGSVIIEGVSQTAIDQFVKAILKSSPEAVPIVNFLLKNGLSYGIYELRREKMNWPFNSVEPMLFDSFKAGFTIIF